MYIDLDIVVNVNVKIYAYTCIHIYISRHTCTRDMYINETR